MARTYSKNRYLHPSVLSWNRRVLAVGGTVTDASLAAHDVFMRALDAASLTSKFLRLDTFGGDQLNASLVPIINKTGFAVELTAGMVSGDYTALGGLKGNGSSKVIHTGVYMKALSLADCALFWYGKNFEQDGVDHCAIGILDGNVAGTGAALQLNVCGAASKPYFMAVRDDATNKTVTLVSSVNKGFIAGSARSLGTMRIFLNGVFEAQQVATTSAVSSSFGRDIFLFGRNQAALQLTAANGFACGISTGLQDSEVATLYTICHALAVTLGRDT